ncbi:hypothetical protein CNMCM5623_004145 [Aspergillus felis]|uniref:Methyltransferase domain-containing protein n=1 Tax=Aspergillus felis TaxID=1287682 RepID=A0A8H6QG12_9EURO|nr:hypothetical protein CNMCM5623_004145 [Aspergillus felis]
MTDVHQIATWYDQNAALEHERLTSCRLEFSITRRIIAQYLDQLGRHKALEILDLGGGTGRYALPLAKLGHSVTLADISDRELEIARSTAEEAQVKLTAIVKADARDIRSNPVIFQEQKYDLVLCQGPLYHLLEENERRAVLSACAAILKPNGVILAAFVLQYAHLRDIAQRDPMRLRDALQGTTALHLAAYGGHIEVVKFLIHAGAEVNAFDFPGLTALHWAAYKGHKDIVALLLENGANPSSLPYHLMDTLRDPTAKGSMGLTAMLDRTNDDGSLLFARAPPLHCAVAGGHDDIVRLLLDRGADLHMEGLGTPYTALETAADRGNGELIKLLMNAGAHASQRALNLAVLSAHTEAAKILLDAGVNASLPDTSGLLPLNRAASLGHETMIRLLLEAGADVHSVDATGGSALHLAASGGHDSVVQLLINAGASTKSTDERGMTPLHHASQGGNLKAVQIILDHNRSASRRDLNELTALHSAANCGNAEVFSVLLQAFENDDTLNYLMLEPTCLRVTNVEELHLTGHLFHPGSMNSFTRQKVLLSLLKLHQAT